MGNVNADEKREMITRKAFELYQKRGCQPGHEMDDWLEAEKAVDRELKGSAKTAPAQTVVSTPAPTSTSASTPAPTPTKQPRSIPTPIRNTSKVGYKRVRG